MFWYSVTLLVDAGSVEALSDALLEAGAMSVDVTDADAGTPHEQPQFSDPGEPGAPAWEHSKIRALFNENRNIEDAVAAALRAAGLPSACRHEVERIADQDWVRASRDQFQPVHVSPRLWVVPSWHAAPDPAAINLGIDPGLAFGTGAHPTTRLCLQWLDANIRGGESVLDYGCGSGILAIAAVKLGAASVTGVDIDAAALLAARHNAMQNQVVASFENADQTISVVYDIVLANILANPLKLLAPLLMQATRAGGTIVLSGILDHQADEVSNVYRPWFAMDAAQHDEGWVVLSGTKKLSAKPQT